MTVGVLLRRRGVEGHAPATVYASDGFSGGTASDISGRSTDSAFGGSTKTWTKGTAGTRLLAINASGQVSNGTGSSQNIYMFDSGQGDVAAYITIVSLSGSTQSIGPCIRQNSTLAAINCYFARIQDNGSGVKGLLLCKDVAGATTSIGVNGLQSWAAGDTIGVRAVGSNIQLVRNGVILESVTDTTYANTRTWCGLRTTSVTFAADNFRVQST